MMICAITIYLYFFNCLFEAPKISAASSDRFKLELLQVIFRHGDRFVDWWEVYKNDPYDPLPKDAEYGELTRKGKQREYEIGMLLRQRYNEFLGDYKTHEVYAYSTDTARTKMSLELVLAGLYPPTRRTAWNKYIHWIPIPTYSKPWGQDVFTKFLFCKSYRNGLEEVKKLSETQEKLSKYSNLFEHIKKSIRVKNVTPELVILIRENLKSSLARGLPLPDWCSKLHLKQIEEVAGIFYDANVYTDEMKRIIVGPFINQVIKTIKDSDNFKNKLKILLFADHDLIIAEFAKVHNITNVPRLPEYGTALIIEKLRGLQDNQIYLRILMWTGVSKRFVPFKIGNFEECLLSNYIKKIKPILPDDEVKKCNQDNGIFNNFTNNVTLPSSYKENFGDYFKYISQL